MYKWIEKVKEGPSLCTKPSKSDRFTKEQTNNALW